ncbi:MAG: DUF2484 family protein [Paracoccaceae bacterium]
MNSAIPALIWMILAALAGMTPNRWHRPIAYILMLAFLPIAWFLGQGSGHLAALGFLVVAVFQLRLLLISWGRKIYRWMTK